MERKPIRTHTTLLLVYLFATVLMTWPVGAQLTTHVAGSGGDPWQSLWRFEEKARGGVGLLAQDVFGLGEPRLANLSVWPWMPLHLTLGQPVAYNLVWLLSFILSGYGMYLLVDFLVRTPSQSRHAGPLPRSELTPLRGVDLLPPPLDAGLANSLTVDTKLLGLSLPAFLAGLYYMFLPYHAAHALGHFGAAQLQWLPLIILMALVWFKQPTFWKTLALGALIIVQAWTEHHYLLWLMILMLFSFVFWFKPIRIEILQKIQGRKHQPSLRLRLASKIQILILAVILVFGVVLPYVPTARLAFSENTPLELGYQQLVRFSADLFSFVVPAPFHSLWGKPVDALFATHFTGNVSEATQYLGISILLLIVFFHRSIPSRSKAFWVGTAVLFAIIALGPRLHLFGVVTSIPLPYTLIDWLPGIASVRAVARAGVFVGLATAVLLGYVLRQQLRRQGAAILVAAVIMVEFLSVPAPTQSAVLSKAYEAIAQVPGRTIVEIPAATNYAAASRALYASHVHGKDVIANIALERAQDPIENEFIKALPALKQLLFIRMTDLRENRTEFFNQDVAETLPDVLTWIEAAGVIIHTDSVSALQRATLVRFLDAQPNLSRTDYEDVILYTKNEVQPQSDGVFLTRDGRWQQVGYDRDRGASFAEIPGEAAVTLINTASEPKRVTLVTPLAPESQSDITITWGDAQITSGTVFSLPPGAHIVTMRAADEGRVILMNPQLLVQ